jgi:hypothetical protein
MPNAYPVTSLPLQTLALLSLLTVLCRQRCKHRNCMSEPWVMHTSFQAPCRVIVPHPQAPRNHSVLCKSQSSVATSGNPHALLPHAASAPAAFARPVNPKPTKSHCSRPSSCLAEVPLSVAGPVFTPVLHPPPNYGPSACAGDVMPCQLSGGILREPDLRDSALHVSTQPHEQATHRPFDAAAPQPSDLETIGGSSQQAAGQTPECPSGQLAAATSLTTEQREVVQRVLAWDDYLIVTGLPGAGKTSTICALAQVCTCSWEFPCGAVLAYEWASFDDL